MSIENMIHFLSNILLFPVTLRDFQAVLLKMQHIFNSKRIKNVFHFLTRIYYIHILKLRFSRQLNDNALSIIQFIYILP